MTTFLTIIFLFIGFGIGVCTRVDTRRSEKVYVLSYVECPHDEYYTIGVFSTYDKAKEYAMEQGWERDQYHCDVFYLDGVRWEA